MEARVHNHANPPSRRQGFVGLSPASADRGPCHQISRDVRRQLPDGQLPRSRTPRSPQGGGGPRCVALEERTDLVEVMGEREPASAGATRGPDGARRIASDSSVERTVSAGTRCTAAERPGVGPLDQRQTADPVPGLGEPDGTVGTGGDRRGRLAGDRVLGDGARGRDPSDLATGLGEPQRAIGTGGDVGRILVPPITTGSSGIGYSVMAPPR
jgi:hypothetical protein